MLVVEEEGEEEGEEEEEVEVGEEDVGADVSSEGDDLLTASTWCTFSMSRVTAR